MIATPSVPLLVIDGALHIEIGSTRYRVEVQRITVTTWRVRLVKPDDTHYFVEHMWTKTRCTCKSFEFGRKLKGTNERVYGSCKHTEKVAALVDVLKALRGSQP